MLSKERVKESKNDSILRHFILLGIFLFEALIKVLNLVIPSINQSIDDNSGSVENKTDEAKEIELSKICLLDKDLEELQNILIGIDLLSSLKKEQLIELIFSSPDALSKVLVEERRSILIKMRNEELRYLLKGTDKVTRLKKSQLVDMILLRDQVTISQKAKQYISKHAS